jgi:hypothetical protein
MLALSLVTGYGMDNLRFIPSMVMDTIFLVCVALPPLSYTSLGMILKQRNNFTLCVYKYLKTDTMFQCGVL